MVLESSFGETSPKFKWSDKIPIRATVHLTEMVGLFLKGVPYLLYTFFFVKQCSRLNKTQLPKEVKGGRIN